MTFRYEEEERWKGTNQRKGSEDNQIERLEEPEGPLIVGVFFCFFLSVIDEMLHLSNVNEHLYATQIVSLELPTQTRGQNPGPLRLHMTRRRAVGIRPFAVSVIGKQLFPQARETRLGQLPITSLLDVELEKRSYKREEKNIPAKHGRVLGNRL